jgi:serine phosphatase RsbU (regulator of sigma subunit)
MKLPPSFFFLFAFFACRILSAQSDTNYIFLSSNLPDSIKYQKFESRIRAITQSNPPYGMKYARFALESFKKTDNKPGIAQANLSIAGAFFYTGQPDSMIPYATKALKIFTEEKMNAKISSAYKNIGLGYEMKAEYQKAAENYFQSLDYAQKSKDAFSIANASASVCNVLVAQKKYEEALKYNSIALHLFPSLNFPAGLAGAYGTRGILYFYIGKEKGNDKYYDSALVMQDSSFAIASRNGIESQRLMSYINKSVVYSQRKEYQKSIEVNQLVYDEAKKGDNPYALALSAVNLGIGYNELKNYPLALIYLKESIPLATQYGFRDLRKEGYSAISETYHNLGDEKTSREYLLSFIALKDSILNEETQKSMNELQVLYESEKKDKEILQKDYDLDKASFRTNILIGCSAGILLFAFFIFRGYRSKQKANILIAAQKAEVEKQKDIIEEKNKGIMDSINYAQRLQKAILVPSEEFSEYFPESLLVYRPKDVVAGDFYFLEKTDTHVFVAAADCTGHGVPGALVSVVCSNALARCVKEFKLTDPAAILEKTKDLVIETFEKSGKDIKDGMDISLLSVEFGVGSSEKSINTPNSQLRTLNCMWAGANNPLWYLQDGVLKEIQANKQPIGKVDDPVPFISHSVTLKKGDSVFLFSDGYPDQFGGPKGKKFKYKQLKDLLLSVHDLPMKVQKEKLETTFDNWKGKLEQVDDVCIIGIRF